MIETNPKCLEIQVLLVPQIGHGKLAYSFDVVHITRRGELAVISADGFFLQKLLRDVSDVVAVVGVLWPAIATGLEPRQTGLHRCRQGGNLHARVVVIELAHDLMTLGCEQIANRVAEGSLSAVTHMQGARRVGGYKLHQYFLLRGRLLAEPLARCKDFAHDGLFGLRIEPQVDEAGAGDLHGLHPSGHRGLGIECGHQVLCDFARIFLLRFGQWHRSRTGQIPMGRLFRQFERSGGHLRGQSAR